MPSRPSAPQRQLRSSIESFLDQYQRVRLALAGCGLLLLVATVVLARWEPEYLLLSVALVVVSADAAWSLTRRVRAPRQMVFLDLTLWGAVMVSNSQIPVVNVASLAILSVLTVLFLDGVWMFGFLVYAASWYAFSFFSGHPATVMNGATFAAVLITLGGLAAAVYRVRLWLGQLDANRSQTLGVVSHELRNNLTGILGVTELVAASGLSQEESNELLEMAHQQAVDATEIVEDMLTASRIERSALDVIVEPVDVNAQIRAVAKRFQTEGTDVGVEVGAGSLLAQGDALRIRQILRNLISNAVRYGGPSISVSSTLDGSMIDVIVGDDGQGVPPEDEATIFLPYRRSANARRDASSVGLGLWICHQLAHAMNGRLEYRRRGGHSEFVLSLPRSENTMAQEASSPLTIPRRELRHAQRQVTPAVRV